MVSHRTETVSAAAALVALLCLSAASLEPGPSTRGRVTNNGTTIVTDWGTPLRGGCWGMDQSGLVFTREEVVTMKLCGLNSIHVYTELTTTTSTKPVGYAAANMDSIVKWCREESLYVVMTHGGPIANSTLDKIKEIWRFYAPRYANETHVVYELKNEPNVQAVPIGKEVYPIVRELAPETHILLLSYSNIRSGPSRITNAIAEIGDAVDWSNASAAYHGYGTTGAFQEAAIKTVNDAGYAMTCTEWPVGADLFAAYERAGISYFHFEACWPGPRTLGTICAHLKKFSVTWQPDFGDWPQPHIDHPVRAAWQPWSGASMREPAPMYRIMFNGLPPHDVNAVYDLSGRLLWRREGSRGAGTQCWKEPGPRVVRVQ